VHNTSQAPLRYLGALWKTGSFAGLSDGQLLERALARSGESSELAFAELVERHGPLVLRVTRSLLRDPHRADDAFQATFLILIRKASSLVVRSSLAPWLLRVAYRVSVHARCVEARRRRLESQAAEFAPAPVRESDRVAIEVLLREEVENLSERHRVPILLCDLGGQTHEEAARSLGVPIGTIKSRLARGRARLRDRLVRRGLAPTVGAWLIGASKNAWAGVPESLAQATTSAAFDSLAAGSRFVRRVPWSVRVLIEEELRAVNAIKIALTGSSALALGLVVATAGLIAQTGGTRPESRAERSGAVDPLTTGPLTTLDGQTPGAEANGKELRERIRWLEAALAQARGDLERLETTGAAKGAPPMPEIRSRPSPSAEGVESRLAEIELKLDEILKGRERSSFFNGFNAVDRTMPPPDHEERLKFEAWAMLLRDGFLGRLDTGSINCVQLYTKLFRTYVGRRPTAEEVGRLSALSGPGWERMSLAPEDFVRRLFEMETFPDSALGRALLTEHSTPAAEGTTPLRGP
jgi:RNA polymerase sigma factor (sigma-70 family)